MANFTAAQSRELLERSLGYEVGELDVSDLVFLDWLNIINQESYQMFYKLEPSLYFEKQTINVVSGTATYALDTDFEDITVEGSGLFLTDDDDAITINQLKTTSEGDTAEGYYFDGSNLVLTPEPTSDDVLILKYIPILDDITIVDTTETVIPTKYRNYLNTLLLVAYWRFDEGKNSEIFEDNRAAIAVKKLESTFKKELSTYYV